MDLEVVKLEVYCRTCLSTTSELSSILENNVLSVLTEYTAIQIKPDDAYSKMICQLCMLTVQQFHLFKLKCVATDRLLREGSATDFHPSPSRKFQEEVVTSCEVTLTDEIEDKSVEKPENSERNQVLECQTCGKKFGIKGFLLSHIKQSHRSHETNASNVVVKTETEPTFEEPTFEENNLEIQTNESDSEDNAPLSLVKLNGSVNRFVRAPAGQKQQRRFKCKTCAYVTSKLSYLIKHEKRHTKFTCPLAETGECFEPLETLDALTTHIKLKHVDFVPKVKCEKCGVAFFVQKQLDNHEARYHADGFCVECDVTVPELGRHTRKYHAGPVKKYKCQDCSSTFGILSNFEAHKKVHANGGDNRTICIHCGVKVVNGNNHMRCKHPEMIPGFNKLKMTCKYCRAQFATLKELFTHSKTEHKEERAKTAGSFNCSKCDKVFATRAGLRTHFRYMHTDERKIACSVCGHISSCKEHLKRHMRVHTDERPFECDFCTKKFKSSSTLQVHKRTHTGERPHLCDICYRSFTQRSAMTTHRRRHGESVSN